MKQKPLKPEKPLKEKVIVFGEEVSAKETKKEDSGVVFGVLLLLSGIVLLLNSLSVIPWGIWNDLFKFWPLLLILGGLQIILGRHPLGKLISFLVSLAVFGTALIYVFQTWSPEILKYMPKKLVDWSNIWEVIIK